MKDSINHQYLLCQDWKRELSFFKDELNVLRSRLDEVASRNTSKDVMVQVEHFENKFRIMSVHFDELQHDVQIKSEDLSSQAAVKANYISVKMMDANTDLEELMAITAKDFYDTRREFYRFLSGVL